MKFQKVQQIVQYVCAVILIVSSVCLAFIQVFDIQTVAHGTLMYIAQAFLLAGSIFGLQYYITKLNNFIDEETKRNPTRNPQQ